MTCQLTVFRVLLAQWTDFCAFRSNLTDDKLTPSIERHRRKARQEEKKRARDAEAKKVKVSDSNVASRKRCVVILMAHVP